MLGLRLVIGAREICLDESDPVGVFTNQVKATELLDRFGK